MDLKDFTPWEQGFMEGYNTCIEDKEKEIKELLKSTEYKDGECAGCMMDHYECDCGTHNFAINQCLKKLNDEDN